MKQGEPPYMQNLSDKELDDLMKKANESQSYSYDSDSWTALSEKLDKTPKRGFAGGQVTLLIIIAGVLLMSVLYFTVSKQSPATAYVATSLVPEKEQDSNLVGNAEKITKIPTDARNEKVRGNDESNGSSKKNDFEKTPVYSEHQKRSTDRKELNTPVKVSVAEPDRGLDHHEQTNTPSNTETQRASPVSIRPVNAISLEEEGIADSAAVEKVEVAEVKSELNVKDSVEEKKDEKVRKSRLAVKLSVSPDFSSQGFSKTDAIGWNYGGAVEYRINKAFAVSAGLLNTRKYYTAEDVTYGKYTAEFAEGDCRMWDIPLNIHYYVPSNQSLQLIGSLGFSSYIMKQENYVYYPDETNKDRKYYSEINNENSEWFKILNVSIAAQLQISPAVYLQLEPFIKAPLTGLGEGNISLSSFGTFFTVKYQFNPKNTQ